MKKIDRYGLIGCSLAIVFGGMIGYSLSSCTGNKSVNPITIITNYLDSHKRVLPTPIGVNKGDWDVPTNTKMLAYFNNNLSIQNFLNGDLNKMKVGFSAQTKQFSFSRFDIYDNIATGNYGASIWFECKTLVDYESIPANTTINEKHELNYDIANSLFSYQETVIINGGTTDVVTDNNGTLNEVMLSSNANSVNSVYRFSKGTYTASKNFEFWNEETINIINLIPSQIP